MKKKRIALDLHIACIIFDTISCFHFTINNYIQGITNNYVVHSAVVSFLSTKRYLNLHEHLGYPPDYGC